MYDIIKKDNQNLLYIPNRGKYCRIRGHFSYLDQLFKWQLGITKSEAKSNLIKIRSKMSDANKTRLVRDDVI